jgi:membrane protein DedA with SNARE-associated domain
MSITEQIFSFATSTMQNAGYGGVFFLMLMESATLPVPSELVLPFAGYLVFLGKFDFSLAVIVASVGSIAGTLIDYFAGYYVGRAAVVRYGRFIHLDEGRLRTAERWFDGRGELTVLLARFVPLVRTLIAFPAGIAHMQLWRFMAFSAVGIFAWDALLIYLGLAAGQNSASIISALTNAFTPIELAAVVLGGIILWAVIRRRPASATR